MSLYPTRASKNSARIAVYDLETTTDLQKVYLCGYYDGTTYRFWESKPLPPEHPDSAVAQFGSWYFEQPHTHEQWLFAHNGGNFDHVFLLKWLFTQSDLRIELIPVQSTILRMRVFNDSIPWREGGGGKSRSPHWKIARHWDFLDSFRLLPGSLNTIAETFLGQKKHDFGGDYDTLHLNPERYRYLQDDCELLYGTLQEYRKRLEGPIGGRLSLSIAGCAMKTFQMSHLEKALHSASEKADEISRAAYYGGRTERFRVEFHGNGTERLRLYDVNSMYPWAMVQPIPVKFLGIKKKPLLSTLLGVDGFVECTVDVPPGTHIPVLPYRQGGKLLFPTGTLTGTWATCELRQAVKHGATIVSATRAAYFRMGQPFDSYVKKLYAFRNKKAADWSALMDLIAKLLLNSLYGKFGSAKERELLHVRPRMEDVVEKHMTPIDSPIGVPVFSERVDVEADYMLPHIAAWITAQSRVRLHEGLASLPPESVYYCDTDSIVTSAELPPSLCGSALGQYKTEMEDIVEAHFVAPKVYSLIGADGKEKAKAKGFSAFGHHKLTSVDIKTLASGESLPTSRFAKARTVMRGDFGLLQGEKRLHLGNDKRIFYGNHSTPINIEE